MIAAICTDDKNGMRFNGRRQSRDRAVAEDLVRSCRGRRLWMNEESAKLFSEELTAQAAQDGGGISVSEEFWRQAGPGEYCFAEDGGLAPFAELIEELIVYRWNRRYPADVFLDIDLSGWELMETTEFPGFSHEKITKERYRKRR